MNAHTFIVRGRAVQLRLLEQHGHIESAVLSLLNRCAALLLVLLFAPLMLAVVWLIWRTDGRPIVFAHYRVGRDGRLFPCLKFRTMVRDAQPVLERLLRENAAAREQWEREHKLDDDPRITHVGRFLRRTSLDELPQLLNVLKGDMALVGPRPITVPELERYGAARWHYLNVRPGMTGLWQVSGRNDVSYEERVRLDRRYVEQRNLRTDVGILLQTVKVVLARDGAR
jgi:lipopolysaccharide/colanic/teichoic acid biosynthesis glycosyltransferase